MITVRHADDVLMSGLIASSDPFQLAPPFYVVRPILPLPVVGTLVSHQSKEDYRIMPVKAVAFTEAPQRLYARGTINQTQDYSDVQAAIRDPQNKGKAFIVTMTPGDWKDVEKPETVFSQKLRRGFDVAGTNWTAYQSAKMEITVRPMSQAEVNARKAAAAKRK